MRLSPAQLQLAKKIMRTGKRGMSMHDMHEGTLNALITQRIIAYHPDCGDHVVLIAPTRRVLRGAVITTVLDLDDAPRTPSLDFGVTG